MLKPSMHVLFLTRAGKKCASAREFFYQMSELVGGKNFEVSLNSFDYPSYDIILIHWADLNLIQRALGHSPKAHIGVLAPIGLGYNKYCTLEHACLLKTVDFFVVTSFMWRDLLLKYGKRVYEVFDFEYTKKFKRRKHTKTDDLVIGYNGNGSHYSRDFFPGGSNALKILARKYRLILKVVTNNISTQPLIPGVKTEFIEWNQDSFEEHLETFDIGICPAFSTMNQLLLPSHFIRNPNRINTLLVYGIPSVASPLPQACQVHRHNETVIFASEQAGWHDGLERLICRPELRQEIVNNGQKLVAEKFNEISAAERFREIFREEVAQSLSVKAPISKQYLKIFEAKKKLQEIRNMLGTSRNIWRNRLKSSAPNSIKKKNREKKNEEARSPL